MMNECLNRGMNKTAWCKTNGIRKNLLLVVVYLAERTYEVYCSGKEHLPAEMLSIELQMIFFSYCIDEARHDYTIHRFSVSSKLVALCVFYPHRICFEIL